MNINSTSEYKRTIHMYKIQLLGNYPEESIQQEYQCFPRSVQWNQF